MKTMKQYPAKTIAFLLFILIALTSYNSFAGGNPTIIDIIKQNDHFLLVDGVIKYGRDTRMVNVEVALVKDGQVAEQVTTNKRGKYRFILEKNADYKLIITKPGYEAKAIEFDTYMPDEAFKAQKYLMAVFMKRSTYDLNEMAEQANESLDPETYEPLALISYDEKYRKFRKIHTRNLELEANID